MNNEATTSKATAVLSAENITAYYRLLAGDVRALEDVTFSLEKGEIFGIAGESGCGKSTLAATLSTVIIPPLKLIGGRLLTDEGEDIFELRPRALRKEIRGKYLALIPQSAMNALNPTKKIKDLIFDAVKAHDPKKPKKEIFKIAEEQFAEIGLPTRALNSYFFELSGGMKQRAVIGISSLLNPKVLVADEPTVALDVSTQKAVLDLLVDLRNKGIVQSIIFITHDIAVLRQIADRIMVMYAGMVVEIGPTEDVVFKPLHPYSNALISTVIVPEPDIKNKVLTGILGAPPNLMNPPSGCRFHPRCKFATTKCKEEVPPLVTVSGRTVRCWTYAEGAK
jgi:peptide/nickel transport system ATP-binding protein